MLRPRFGRFVRRDPTCAPRLIDKVPRELTRHSSVTAVGCAPGFAEDILTDALVAKPSKSDHMVHLSPLDKSTPSLVLRTSALGRYIARWLPSASLSSVPKLNASNVQPRTSTRDSTWLYRCSPRRARTAGSRFIVIDVGELQGHPVKTTALQRLARVVVSVEPDPGAFPTLAALRVSKNNLFVPINAALSEPDAQGRRILPALQLNAICLDCPISSIPVSTVDSLILDGYFLDKAKLVGNLDMSYPSHATLRVQLLRSRAHGHERKILGGASRLLATGRVRNVIIEFDPNLMPSKADAVDTLQRLFNAGFS